MKPHQILLYDAIFDGDAKRIRAELAAAGKKPIELRINSPGGSVFEGYAIYNALLGHAAGVSVFVDGLAASMASYIAMVGQPIVMADNAMLMIHNPTTGTSGDAEDMRKLADLLDKVTTSIVDAYARRTKQPADRIREMMDEETWLTAEMALEMGFIDQIAPARQEKSFDMSRFRNLPANLSKSMSDQITAEAHSKVQATVIEQMGAITNLTNELAATKKQLDTVIAERDLKAADLTNLTGQITVLTTERDGLKGQVTNLTGERDMATKEITFLEFFCKANGIDLTGVDRTKAVPEVVDGGRTGEDVLAQLNAITDPTLRADFYNKHSAEIAAAWRGTKVQK